MNQPPESFHIKGISETGSVKLNGKTLLPNASQKVYNHSPDGFNWGYGGSGPAQLALAICIELYGENIASKLYQNFKFEFVAKWPMERDINANVDIRQFNQRFYFRFAAELDRLTGNG